jgi:hypothetical protein
VSHRGSVVVLIFSYWNVLILRKKQGKALFTPLLGYLPFLTHSLILVAWLQAEIRGGVSIVHDARLLPFLGYWGMSYVAITRPASQDTDPQIFVPGLAAHLGTRYQVAIPVLERYDGVLAVWRS